MKVCYFMSQKPLYFNLDNWNIDNSPVLLVTGLSGGGKTTFANRFAKSHNAAFISFDVLKFYPNTSKQSQDILKIFLKKHSEIKKLIKIQWAKTDKQYSNDINYNYYCNLFFDFLVEYAKKNRKKIVLEGIQIFVRLHPSKSAGLPVIVIRKSCISALLNKIDRDYPKLLSLNILLRICKDIYLYYFRQKHSLNLYIKYLSIIQSNNNDGR